MALGPVGHAAATPAPAPAREAFRTLLEPPGGAGDARAAARVPVRLPEQGAPAPGPPSSADAGRWVEGVRQAQAQLEHVLALAEAGRHFTPAELLGLQARVYQASQELDLAGKVVEKAVGGVKQVLQTQL